MHVDDFYEHLKTIVKHRHTTIDTLCSKIEMSKSSYNTLRRDKNWPRMDTIIKMSKALGVSLDYLAYGYEIQNDNSQALAKANEQIIELQKTLSQIK